MITLQTVKPSHVLLPIVYRYMDKKYIDLFFDKGLIRLGSFLKFQEYPDEIRGDVSEGKGAIKSKSEDGFQVVGVTEVGNDAYIFCTSIIESEELKKEFQTDGCFRIKDPLGFSLAMANSILGFSHSVQGLCNYQDFRLVDKPINGMSVKDFTNEAGELIIGGPKMFQRLGEMVGDGTDLMFLKEKKYQKQAEYRFIWKINTQYFELQKYIDVECKEAIQFCERLKDN
jgi:hypothetical protein